MSRTKTINGLRQAIKRNGLTTYIREWAWLKPDYAGRVYFPWGRHPYSSLVEAELHTVWEILVGICGAYDPESGYIPAKRLRKFRRLVIALIVDNA